MNDILTKELRDFLIDGELGINILHLIDIIDNSKNNKYAQDK